MRFASLGSGSRGNALLVESGGGCLMVDNGFGLREVKARLARLDRSPEDIDAVLVTHEHGDHAGGVVAFARRYRVPVWLTAGTRRALSVADTGRIAPGDGPAFQEFNGHTPFALAGLEVHPCPVPHDAAEPVQFVFSDGRHRLGLLTDTGHVTAHLVGHLRGCHALLIECNHDRALLADGPYPPALKARIAGPYGHLANDEAADLLQRLHHPALGFIAALHLSETNNTPAQAGAALAATVQARAAQVAVADQAGGLPWQEVGTLI